MAIYKETKMPGQPWSQAVPARHSWLAGLSEPLGKGTKRNLEDHRSRSDPQLDPTDHRTLELPTPVSSSVKWDGVSRLARLL